MQYDIISSTGLEAQERMDIVGSRLIIAWDDRLMLVEVQIVGL